MKDLPDQNVQHARPFDETKAIRRSRDVLHRCKLSESFVSGRCQVFVAVRNDSPCQLEEEEHHAHSPIVPFSVQRWAYLLGKPLESLEQWHIACLHEYKENIRQPVHGLREQHETRAPRQRAAGLAAAEAEVLVEVRLLQLVLALLLAPFLGHDQLSQRLLFVKSDVLAGERLLSEWP